MDGYSLEFNKGLVGMIVLGVYAGAGAAVGAHDSALRSGVR